jgi:hypothetical protein
MKIGDLVKIKTRVNRRLSVGLIVGKTEFPVPVTGESWNVLLGGYVTFYSEEHLELLNGNR